MILHILKRGQWDDAVRRGTYAPSTLGAEGFIHCSTIEQAGETANLFFRGERDLVVLCIEEKRLASPLKWEAPASATPARSDGLFPHIHGPMNPDAVIRVVDFPCDSGGSFHLPAALLDLTPEK